MSYVDITSTAELRDLCDRARHSGRLGLDTEFLWERTYAPRLCLAQIAVEDTVALADPLNGVDLEPLADIIADPDVLVVMHAPHADLAAFSLHFGVEPHAVIDTQVAAGFIGESAGLSYGRLVEVLIGHRVVKGEAYTDWSRRPLSDAQLEYAAEDARHLFAVVDVIEQRAEELGRLDWIVEEMQRRYEGIGRFITDPLEAWRKVARRNRLNGAELAVLQAVAAWRERTARDRDVPTSRILKDPTLVEIAVRRPSSDRELRAIRGAEGSIAGRDVPDILAAVDAGAEAEPVRSGRPPDRSVQQRVSVARGPVMALMRMRADEAQIASELVATTHGVEELIEAVTRGLDESVPLLRGWRRQVVGNELVDLIEGRIAMRLVPERPFLKVIGADD